MGWDTRRKEHNTENPVQAAKMAIGAPKATPQGSTALVNKAKPKEGTPSSNAPIHLVGPDNNTEVSEWAPLEIMWEQHRQILTIDSIGCPLANTQPHSVDIVLHH
jgi:hypothetical protein